MKRIFICAAAASALQAFALPRVDLDEVVLAQSGRVTVSYILRDAPGIVTVDFQTNTAAGAWTSIGVHNFTNVTGAVNRYVGETGVRKNINWRYAGIWPGQHVTNGFRAVVKAWPVDDPPDYAALTIDGSKNHRFYTCAEAVPGGVTNVRYKTDVLLMRRVHADNRRFAMGGASGERGNGSNDGSRRHWVSFTNDWYMGVYELTQMQALKIFGNRWALDVHLGLPDSDIMPATTIHYGHISASKAAAATGNVAKFSVPTEAQWEYTCRADCPMALYNYRELGDDGYSSDPVVSSTNLNEIAWYQNNIDDGLPRAVGLLKPNDWGFYDMLGNMQEYCRDYYVADPSTVFDWSTEQIDPQGPTPEQTTNSGKYRVKRGGGIITLSSMVTCAARDSIHGAYPNQNIGLRLQCAAAFDFEDSAQ